MDSIAQYGTQARGGGPAGEIVVRESLEAGLRYLGFEPVIATGDADFADKTRDEAKQQQFALYFFDPWTVVAPGNRARAFLPGREAQTYILDYFGTSATPPVAALPALTPDHILSPYDVVNGNTFVGFVMDWAGYEAKYASPSALEGGGRVSVPGIGEAASVAALPGVQAGAGKILQAQGQLAADSGRGGAVGPLYAKPDHPAGVVWGKSLKYLRPHAGLLRQLCAESPDLVLHSTLPEDQGRALNAPCMRFHGPQKRSAWLGLLAASHFLLGLQDPLAGPSAVEAVARGASFLNPAVQMRGHPEYDSQHPFVAERVGQELVCAVDLASAASVQACVAAAAEGVRERRGWYFRELGFPAYVNRLAGVLGDGSP